MELEDGWLGARTNFPVTWPWASSCHSVLFISIGQLEYMKILIRGQQCSPETLSCPDVGAALRWLGDLKIIMNYVCILVRVLYFTYAGGSGSVLIKGDCLGNSGIVASKVKVCMSCGIARLTP